MLPNHFAGTELTLQRVRESLAPGAWLTDETLSVVYNHMRLPNGAPLPETILLVDPGTSTLLSLGDDTDSQVNVADLDVHKR